MPPRPALVIQQDYRYAVSGIKFYGGRFPGTSSSHPKGLDASLQKLSIYSTYSQDALSRSVNKLEITEDQLTSELPSDASVVKYFQSLLASAEGTDWLMELVAMIPGVVVRCLFYGVFVVRLDADVALRIVSVPDSEEHLRRSV